jgi:hypothetical protein
MAGNVEVAEGERVFWFSRAGFRLFFRKDLFKVFDIAE